MSGRRRRNEPADRRVTNPGAWVSTGRGRHRRRGRRTSEGGSVGLAADVALTCEVVGEEEVTGTEGPLLAVTYFDLGSAAEMNGELAARRNVKVVHVGSHLGGVAHEDRLHRDRPRHGAERCDLQRQVKLFEVGLLIVTGVDAGHQHRFSRRAGRARPWHWPEHEQRRRDRTAWSNRRTRAAHHPGRGSTPNARRPRRASLRPLSTRCRHG